LSAADPPFLDHREERLLGRLARIEEQWENSRALEQLRGAQARRTKPRFPAVIAVALR
jgi:hypothetical protein